MKYVFIVVLKIWYRHSKDRMTNNYNKRAPSGRDPRLRGKVIQTIIFFLNIICQKIIIIVIAHLYGHIIMKTFTSDGLVYVYKVMNCTGMLVFNIIIVI